MLLTNVAGVLDASGNLIPQLFAHEVEAMIARGEITGGMVPKVRSAIETCHETGIPVSIASWRDAAGIAGLGNGSWLGTRISIAPGAPALATEVLTGAGAAIAAESIAS
jgi:acetylglutamate kinase